MDRGRAHTPEDKREVIERLYAAWLLRPGLRLGQLITNAAAHNDGRAGVYYLEDYDLAAAVEAFTGA